VSLTFASEIIHGKSVRIFLASTYDEYFDQKTFAVGSKMSEEIGLVRKYPATVAHYRIPIPLSQSPGGATNRDTTQSIRVLAVTLLPIPACSGLLLILISIFIKVISFK